MIEYYWNELTEQVEIRFEMPNQKPVTLAFHFNEADRFHMALLEFLGKIANFPSVKNRKLK